MTAQRWTWTLAIAFALMPTAVRANPKLVAIGGVNAGVGNLRSPDLYPTATRPGVEASADVGYRVHPAIAVGVHLAMGMFLPFDAAGSIAMPNNGVTYQPIQMAIGLQIAIADRGWFAPYVGVEDGQLGDYAYRGLLVGASAGFDLGRCQNRRWGLLIGVSRSHEALMSALSSPTFIAARAGVGFRFW